jgi:sporulation protein YlmC with PRC-barrel domain
MKTIRSLSLAGAILVVPLAATTFAQQPQTGAREVQPAASDQVRLSEAGLVDANWLIDAPVRSTDGTDLGSIARVWLDPRTGQVQQVVIKAGGIAGEPVTRRVVSWQDVNVAWTEQRMAVTVDADTLGRAPEFTEAEPEPGRAPAASPPTAPAQR